MNYIYIYILYIYIYIYIYVYIHVWNVCIVITIIMIIVDICIYDIYVYVHDPGSQSVCMRCIGGSSSKPVPSRLSLRHRAGFMMMPAGSAEGRLASPPAGEPA